MNTHEQVVAHNNFWWNALRNILTVINPVFNCLRRFSKPTNKLIHQQFIDTTIQEHVLDCFLNYNEFDAKSYPSDHVEQAKIKLIDGIRTARSNKAVELDLSGLDLSSQDLEDLEPLIKLLLIYSRKIISIDLSGNNRLSDFRGIFFQDLVVNSFPNLIELKLDGCTGLTTLAGIEQLTHLVTLNLSGCRGLTKNWRLINIPGLPSAFPDARRSIRVGTTRAECMQHIVELHIRNPGITILWPSASDASFFETMLENVERAMSMNRVILTCHNYLSQQMVSSNLEETVNGNHSIHEAVSRCFRPYIAIENIENQLMDYQRPVVKFIV